MEFVPEQHMNTGNRKTESESFHPHFLSLNLSFNFPKNPLALFFFFSVLPLALPSPPLLLLGVGFDGVAAFCGVFDGVAGPELEVGSPDVSGAGL